MHLHVLILLFSLLWLLLLFSLLQKVCMSFPQGNFFFFHIKLVLKDVEIEGVKLALPNLHLCKQEPTWSVWGSDFPPCPSLIIHSTCGVSSWACILGCPFPKALQVLIFFGSKGLVLRLRKRHALEAKLPSGLCSHQYISSPVGQEYFVNGKSQSGFALVPELNIRKFLRWEVHEYLVLVNVDLPQPSCFTYIYKKTEA